MFLPLNQLYASSADCNMKNYTPGSYLYSFSLFTLKTHSSIALHWHQSPAGACCFWLSSRASFRGAGRHCARTAERLRLLPRAHRPVQTLTAHPAPFQRNPSWGVALMAFIPCSPESLIMFGALNQTHLVNSHMSVSARSF